MKKLVKRGNQFRIYEQRGKYLWYLDIKPYDVDRWAELMVTCMDLEYKSISEIKDNVIVNAAGL